MRLRNRQLNAEFWTDPWIMSLPDTKKLAYFGLVCIAEDSGCLEDSPPAWKVLLFPMSDEVTAEVYASWRDEWLGLGKLRAYEVKGQRYLFLARFHDWQHPRNPQKPNIPLPEWVTFDDAEDHRKRKYVLDPDLLKCRTNLVPTSYDTSYEPRTTVVHEARRGETRRDEARRDETRRGMPTSVGNLLRSIGLKS